MEVSLKRFLAAASTAATSPSTGASGLGSCSGCTSQEESAEVTSTLRSPWRCRSPTSFPWRRFFPISLASTLGLSSLPSWFTLFTGVKYFGSPILKYIFCQFVNNNNVIRFRYPLVILLLIAFQIKLMILLFF